MEIIAMILQLQPYILTGVVIMGIIDIANNYALFTKINFTNKDRIVIIALWPIVIISCIIQLLFRINK
jgi:hypothetical protein